MIIHGLYLYEKLHSLLGDPNHPRITLATPILQLDLETSIMLFKIGIAISNMRLPTQLQMSVWALG
jgi:hypothetical protein